MIEVLKKTVWKNFAAGIDMLKNAIALQPEENWHSNKKFFYNAYHTLVFLDYYLTIPPENFVSPFPYTLTKPGDIPDEAIDDVIPGKIYLKNELLEYAGYCREKCRQLIAGLTEEKLNERWVHESGNMNLDLASSASLPYNVLEILFYNLRHVQHHAAQLNMMLRQTIDQAPGYISQAKDDLDSSP